VRVPSPVLFESLFVSTSPWIRPESRRPYCSSHSSFRQVRRYGQSPVARTVRIILRFDKSVDTARVPSPVLLESFFVSTSPWIRPESRRPYCSSHSSFRQVRGYGQSPVARTARVILRFDKSVDTARVPSPVLLESVELKCLDLYFFFRRRTSLLSWVCLVAKSVRIGFVVAVIAVVTTLASTG
ncbi:hypothetical protein LSAT2_018963, partial [Lamellibrachia satsuma]